MNAYFMRFSFVCDHWVYLSSLGLIALASALIVRAVESLRAPAVLPGLAAIVLSVLAMLTWRQCGMYADKETLWRVTIARNPDNWLAHNDLSSDLLQEGKADEAMVHLQKAMEVQPDYPETYYNLGDALVQKGRVDEAITQYQKAVAIQPNYTEAHINLGVALFKKGRVDEAVACFQKALEINPGNPSASYNLTHMAWVLATSPQASVRNGVKAVALVEQVEQLAKGRNPLVLETLATAYAEAGRFPEAVATAERAQQLAVQQGNTSLTDILGRQIKLYQAGKPFRDASMHVAPTPLAPP
jgi:tetratricopeptide (TPR) repeat protein